MSNLPKLKCLKLHIDNDPPHLFISQSLRECSHLQVLEIRRGLTGTAYRPAFGKSSTVCHSAVGCPFSGFTVSPEHQQQQGCVVERGLFHDADGVISHLTALTSLSLECSLVQNPISSPALRVLELSGPCGCAMLVSMSDKPSIHSLPIGFLGQLWILLTCMM
jgi:hypothetical protein